MARHDSEAVDPGDILPETQDFGQAGGVNKRINPVLIHFGRRAADSMDPRDGQVPINSRWLYDQNALRHSSSRD